MWSYADRTRVDTRTAMSRGMLTMKATFAAAEREAAQERTREALRRKAAAGHVAGGRVLGYENVRQGDGGPVARVVNEAEAAIVRRIFEMASEGKGLLRITRALNDERVKNPTGQDRSKASKRSDEWSRTGIHAVLHRRLYLGEIVYGQTRNEYRHGRRVKVEGEQPITRQDEALRIVSDDLWKAAHNRIGRERRAYLQRPDGKLGGKPSPGYLLSGFLKCGVCGGNLIISKKTGKRGRPEAYYICATYKDRPGACTHKYSISAPELHAAVVTQLKKYLVDSMIVAHFHAQCQAPKKNAAELAAIDERIVTLKAEIDRAATLVFAGSAPAAIVDGLRQREAEVRDLQAKREHLQGLSLAELPDLMSPEGIKAWQASLAPVLAPLVTGSTATPH